MEGCYTVKGNTLKCFVMGPAGEHVEIVIDLFQLTYDMSRKACYAKSQKATAINGQVTARVLS